MKRNSLVKKAIGAVLALGAIAAIGLGSATTASARPLCGYRETVRVERFVPVYRPRFGFGFYVGPRFVVRRGCWR